MKSRNRTNPSSDLEHLSSEKRRGLEEAAKAVECIVINGNDCREVAGMRAFRAFAVKTIRSLIPPSSEGGEEKTDG